MQPLTGARKKVRCSASRPDPVSGRLGRPDPSGRDLVAGSALRERATRGQDVWAHTGDVALADLYAAGELELGTRASQADRTALSTAQEIPANRHNAGGGTRTPKGFRPPAPKAGGAPDRVILDFDATPISIHSEKELAAGHYKGGFGFNPLIASCGREVLAGILRPGNAGANNAADHLSVLELALEQLPESALDGDILARSDSAGASHDFASACRETRIRYSLGYPINSNLREQILALGESAWTPAVNQDGEPREGAWVTELTGLINLSSWPQGTRLICRRERPHPGAQLSFTDLDGHRFQCLITDQDGKDIAALEALHRQHAEVEDRVKTLKATGAGYLPFHRFQANATWFELAMLAHDIMVWTQQLGLDGEHAASEPKRLR